MIRTKVSEATARMNALSTPPVYWSHKCYYVWNIILEDTSTLIFHHPSFLKMGDTSEEAVEYCNKVKDIFKNAGIHDGDMVDLLFERSGDVRAIGNKERNVWIDLSDKFATKTFNQLGVVIVPFRNL